VAVALRYANEIWLGEGADFRLFMRASLGDIIAYDPGITLENASSARPTQMPGPHAASTVSSMR